jgi:hypothetical protein
MPELAHPASTIRTMTTHAESPPIGAADRERSGNDARDIDTVTVAEAARLLGRDRTRVSALLRSGDLIAAPESEDEPGPVRIVRASLERWLVAGGAQGGPPAPKVGRSARVTPGHSSAWPAATSRSRSAASGC